MTTIFHPLLAMVASSADSHLARYVEYLKEENKILRSRIPGQVHTTPAERSRLVQLGQLLGRSIEELVTIVKPATFYRCCREQAKAQGQPTRPARGKRGQRNRARSATW